MCCSIYYCLVPCLSQSSDRQSTTWLQIEFAQGARGAAAGGASDADGEPDPEEEGEEEGEEEEGEGGTSARRSTRRGVQVVSLKSRATPMMRVRACWQQVEYEVWRLGGCELGLGWMGRCGAHSMQGHKPDDPRCTNLTIHAAVFQVATCLHAMTCASMQRALCLRTHDLIKIPFNVISRCGGAPFTPAHVHTGPGSDLLQPQPTTQAAEARQAGACVP